jgi:hypothetical protein
MQHRTLAGHLARPVQIDHCSACRLVWFDALESVNLAPMGWVALLRELQRGSGLALPHARQATLACPHCTSPFKTVHNRTRFGAFAALECPQGHGHLHTHTGVLAERGLARPLLPADRDALMRGRKQLACVNCGAPADGQATACSYCACAIVVIDLPRLMHALTRPLGDDSASPRASGRAAAWHCVACGSALDPARQAQCPACATAAMAPSLPELGPLLDAAEAELQSPQRAAAAAEALASRRPPAGKRKRDWRDTSAARVGDWFRHDSDDSPLRSAETALWRWLWGHVSAWPAPWRWGSMVALLAALAWWWA